MSKKHPSAPAPIQVLIENAKVGSHFTTTLAIDDLKAADVTVHCSEVMNDGNHKVFAVFSHGVQISEVKATKEAGKWVPR